MVQQNVQMFPQMPARRPRRPVHPFQLRSKPWTIQPFLIAPVLPGETMQNLLLQARVVTDPLLNPLIGWWKEYYFFYVKHRDLQGRADFTEMMLDPSYSLATYNEAANVKYYHATSTISWVKECLETVVLEYFRHEGEAWDVVTIDGMPAASIAQETWLDSVQNDASFVAEDINVDLDASGTIFTSEVERAMQQWHAMTAHGLINMSYEDYLRSYGIRAPDTEVHVPELLRFVREWTYPTNTVDPSTGSPSSACSWSIRERADKARFFQEPGFVFGVTTTRPKVYLSNQNGSVTDLLTDAYTWLPAVMLNDFRTSMKQVAATTPPLSSNTDAYWVDLRDLFLYGEQFVNFSLAATDAGMVAMPTAALQKRYPTEAMADALWSDQVTPLELVREDGVVSMQIQSHQMDQTPTI